MSPEMTLPMPATLPVESPVATPLVARVEPTVDVPNPNISGLAGIDLLLRDPARFIDALNRSDNPTEGVRTLLFTTLVMAMAFGAAVGTFRGGRQIAFGAIKLPIVELLTAMVCAPVFSALNAAVHGAGSVRRDFALILAALTFGTLLAAGLSPLLLLADARGIEYHQMVLLLVSICVVSGGWGLSVFLAGLRGGEDRGRLIVGAVMVGVLAVVGAQTSWLFRPYLLRPSSETIPFDRSVENDFITSVRMDIDSARGRYRSGISSRGVSQ